METKSSAKINLIDKLSAKLVSEGLVTEDQLEQVKKRQKETSKSLGEVLVQMQLLTEDELISFIANQLDVPHIDLGGYIVEQEVLDKVPEQIARKYKLIPLFKVEDTITVAMANPLDVFALDQIKMQVGLEVDPALATEESITRAIEEYYGGSRAIDEVMEDVAESRFDLEEEEIEGEKLERISEQAPIVKLVNKIISEAVKDRASDIHVEPQRSGEAEVRYRIDGILHVVSNVPKKLKKLVISRLKVMSKLDITERRIPQDGHFSSKVKNKAIDVRVSTLPIIFGEKVAMRILDKSAMAFKLGALGFDKDGLERFTEMIHKNSGVILITGPTGSGKTSTLYAALNVIKSPEKNITTLEDPVEYQIKGLNQAQINPKVGLNFTTGLRSILRQDPDVIMVGEIRDLETAELAVRSALTGHLVFSTLHTFDVSGSLTRLFDMGVEPFLIASSVKGIVSQRLVRTICQDCKEEYKPPKTILKRIGLENKKDVKFYRGKGCKRCKNMGYKGRTGLYEVALIDDELGSMIMGKTSAADFRKVLRKTGVESLLDKGIKKAVDGITTIEEVLRVCQES